MVADHQGGRHKDEGGVVHFTPISASHVAFGSKAPFRLTGQRDRSTPMTGPSGRPRRQVLRANAGRRPVSQVAVGALLYCLNKDRSMASAIALYPASFG